MPEKSAPAPKKFPQKRPTPERIAYIVSRAPKAQEAYAACKERYGESSLGEAEAVVVLGGDGTMLRALHKELAQKAPPITMPIFGMNCGNYGFLLNPFALDGLPERIAKARSIALYPLRMLATDLQGVSHEFSAFNEVTLFRRHRNPISVQILVDKKERMEALICDGVLIATPAGSSAYNFSAHGPIIPLGSKLLALTPISPFRPRRWRGALLPNRAKITLVINNPESRETTATADFHEVEQVQKVEVVEDRKISVPILFDPDALLSERILLEQFRI